MKTTTIEEEIQSNGNRKTMLGLRCFAELKFKLTEDAKSLGLTLSEYCENILLNNESLLIEKNNAIKDVTNIQRKMSTLQAIFTEFKAQQKMEIQKANAENEMIKNESVSVKTERDKLKKEMDLLNKQIALFSDKRLLFLFEKIKGQKDMIDGADGQKYSFTYNHPKDLLEAMIYSFNIKKP
jgi:hypothetical protein